MHPYYGEGEQVQVKKKNSDEDYCQARDRIFETWKNKGNVVVFEMNRHGWFDNFKNKIMPRFEKGLYLVPTDLCMPDPAETTIVRMHNY